MASLARYRPLIIILLIITLASAALAWEACDAHLFMRGFMGLFFLIFAMFKLFDLGGFVKGFTMYDLLAKRVPAYGYAYPFVELALGLLFLSGALPGAAALATLLLMSVSAVWVLLALRRGLDVRCACLGTLLDVPLTTVSLWENIGMGGMAGLQLLQ